MLGILNIILAIALTIIYSVTNGIPLNFLGILTILLAFILSFIIFFIVLFLPFVIVIYATEKTDHKSAFKHMFLKAYSRYIFKFFYRAKLITTGKENLPKDNNFVVYANHIEYTDPIYILMEYKQPLAFISKEPLFKFPVLKNLLRGIGCIPISPYADKSALKTILLAIKQVKEGQPMGVFPEGKRTYSNDLIAFKPGAFRVAEKAKAAISPVCIYNMHALSKKLRIFPTKVYMHILPLIKYEEYKDLDSIGISNLVFEKIQEQMNKFKTS
ncbi:MAG: 1-acyl-sn-glycerol-3-phosphate acyltransferase [Tenericutes bacterium]|nr:1-acyl-sn-glycerol-3-phosphate acyltransferase [Mycoplasmatota bacterium]